MSFWIAFAAGLAVVLLFAGDQFNRRSWAEEQRLERILTALNPNDLRGARAQRRAFAVYLTLLTLLYFAIVFLLWLGVIRWEGTEAFVGGVLPGETSAIQPPEPWVPLAVSLALVNLAPRLPLIGQLEAKFREKTHEMMGIPAGLIAASERIEAADLTIEGIGPRYVTDADRTRLDRLVSAAEAEFGDIARVDRFERVMIKLIAFRSWVLDDHWPARTVRVRYSNLEKDLRHDIDALLADLDPLIGDSARVPQDDGTLQSLWDERMRRASKLCLDVCALMFVYADQERVKERPEQVEAFLRRALDERCPHLDILVNSLTLAVLVAFAWGLVADLMGATADGRLGATAINGVLFGLSALFIYGPSMLAVLWWRRRQGGSGLTDPYRMFSARRYVAVFVGCAAASFVALVLFEVVQGLVRGGLPSGVAGFSSGGERLLDAVGFAMRSQAYFAVLGGMQGVFVAAYLSLSDDQIRGWQSKALVAVNALVLFGWAQSAAMAAPALSGTIGLAIGSLMVLTLSRLREAAAPATP